MRVASSQRSSAACRPQTRSKVEALTTAPRADTGRMEHRFMPEREPFDAFAGLRAMADVQRAGRETAAAVVERMLELGRQSARSPFPLHLPAEAVGGVNGDGDDAARKGGREARRLRADAERL